MHFNRGCVAGRAGASSLCVSLRSSFLLDRGCWNLLFGGHKRLEFGASEVEQIAHTNTQEVHATQGWLDNFAMIFVGATLPADKLVNLIASPLRDVISTMLSDVDSLKSDYGISVGTECRFVLSTSWNAFGMLWSFTNQVLAQLVVLRNRQTAKT